LVSSRTVPAAAVALVDDPYAQTLPTGQAVITPPAQVYPAGQLNAVVYPLIVHVPSVTVAVVPSPTVFYPGVLKVQV